MAPAMGQTTPFHLQMIRDAAEHAQSGQSDDVRSYIAAITQPFVPEGPVKETLDERVTTLHMRYLAGEAPAVSEGTLVSALNHLASKMALPQYGRTSPLEFRLFRMAVLRMLPQLNPTAQTQPDETTTADGKLTKAVSSKMTPAEVTYLVGLLQLQKRVNPSFQVTEAELQQQYAAYHNATARRGNQNSAQSGAPTQSISEHPQMGNIDPARMGVVDVALQSFWNRSTPAEMSSLLDSFAKELGYE
jgi:hypothetical protein